MFIKTKLGDSRRDLKSLFNKEFYESWPMEWVLLGGKFWVTDSFKQRKTCIDQYCYGAFCTGWKFFLHHLQGLSSANPMILCQKNSSKQRDGGRFWSSRKLFTNKTKKIDRFDYIKIILSIHTKTKNKTKNKKPIIIKWNWKANNEMWNKICIIWLKWTGNHIMNRSFTNH